MENIPCKKTFNIFESGRFIPARISVTVEEDSLIIQKWIMGSKGQTPVTQEFQLSIEPLSKLIEVLQQAKLFVDSMKEMKAKAEKQAQEELKKFSSKVTEKAGKG